MDAWLFVLDACSFGFVCALSIAHDNAPAYLKWVSWVQCYIVGFLMTLLLGEGGVFGLAGGAVMAVAMYLCVGIGFGYATWLFVRMLSKLIGYILGLAENKYADKVYDFDHYDINIMSKVAVTVNLLLFAIFVICTLAIMK